MTSGSTLLAVVARRRSSVRTRAANLTPRTSAMYRGAFVLQDDSDPVFTSPPAGSLPASGTLAGTHGASFSATDAGGGLYEAVIEVDGQPRVAVARLRPAVLRHRALQAHRQRDGLARHLGMTDGQHSVRILLGTPPGPTRPRSARSRSRRRTRRRRARDGLASADVRFDRGGRFLRRAHQRARPDPRRRRPEPSRGCSAASARGRVDAGHRYPGATDAGGRFTYRVPAGPRGRSGSASGAPPTLFTSARGALNVPSALGRLAVGFATQLRAGRSRAVHRTPARGLHSLRGSWSNCSVRLRPWRSLRTVRTNSRGVSATVWLPGAGPAATLPVRAVVRAESGYPFALGTSSRVNVRVR